TVGQFIYVASLGVLGSSMPRSHPITHHQWAVDLDTIRRVHAPIRGQDAGLSAEQFSRVICLKVYIKFVTLRPKSAYFPAIMRIHEDTSEIGPLKMTRSTQVAL